MSNVATSRREVRSLIFHLLYAMESFDYTVPLTEIIYLFNREFETDIPEKGEVEMTVQEIVNKRDSLDEKIIPLLANWRLDRLGCSTRLILRLAIWEMEYTDTASTIVINEAIELSKGFSEKDAYKFVNGILDEAAKQRVALNAESEAE
ncbi:MAG: N utilization substance protein B [Alteromonas naphthalenivorans]|jgi:N utilization substance protein B